MARIGAAIGIVRACFEFRPTVIHLNQAGCYRVALPAATLFAVPIVAHVRIFEDVEYLAKQNPNPRRLRGIVAISSAVERALRGETALSEIPIHMLYDPYAAKYARSERRDDRGMTRIGCVGRVAPIKGQDLLIDAAHQLMKGGEVSFKCLIAGDGQAEYVSQLKSKAAGGAAASSIIWLGTLSDVGPMIRTCVALVCPSRREPLGRVIFEAWDAGAVPLACASSGGAAEVIAAADGGILYPDPSPKSLAAALRTVLQMPEHRAKTLVARGRAWVAEHCDQKKYGKALAKILAAAG